MAEQLCPICGKGTIQHKASEDGDHCTCRLCGRFVLESFLDQDISAYLDLSVRHRVSGVIRRHWEKKKRPLFVSSDNCRSLEQLAPPDSAVSEKAMCLLEALAWKTTWPGQQIYIKKECDYSLAFCHNQDEFAFFVDHLVDLGCIKWMAEPSWSGGLCITPSGWSRLASSKSRNMESDKAFVAMWFDAKMIEAYENGIEPAIKECGFRPVRIDKKEFLGDIVDEIIAEIRESRFVVADFTGQRAGVYYEAGYAAGLGIPVVLTCREDDMDELHFDTQQKNHIAWQSSEQLRKRLRNRIRALIGLGPHHAD